MDLADLRFGGVAIVEKETDDRSIFYGNIFRDDPVCGPPRCFPLYSADRSPGDPGLERFDPQKRIPLAAPAPDYPDLLVYLGFPLKQPGTDRRLGPLSLGAADNFTSGFGLKFFPGGTGDSAPFSGHASIMLKCLRLLFLGDFRRRDLAQHV